MKNEEVRAKSQAMLETHLSAFAALREALSKAIADGRATPEMADALRIACDQERLAFVAMHDPEQLQPR